MYSKENQIKFLFSCEFPVWLTYPTDILNDNYKHMVGTYKYTLFNWSYII